MKLKTKLQRERCHLEIADAMQRSINDSTLDTLSRARYSNAVERAIYLIRRGATAQRLPGHWRVSSETTGEVYTLDDNEKRIVCSCPAGRKQHPCKHGAIVAIVKRYAEAH